MKKCQKCDAPIEGRVAAILKKVIRIKPPKNETHLCAQCAPKPRGGYVCQICERTISEENALTHVKAEEYLLHLIKKDHPEWKGSNDTSPECLAYYRKLIREANI